ncbi:MAG: Ig-like domain repeat protein, partial [Clostridia bacterium]|nr:Ig-like domain repeat protein [Clostridia bacterium]
WNGYDDIGAYRLYGQYMDYGKTDDLDGKNGWTYGQTGQEASLIGSGITSTGSHKSRAYKTAVEYRTASGRKDMVAQLYVTSGSNRTDWVAKLELLKYTKGSDDKYTPSVTSTVTLGASPALDESGMIFQQYFDALYDITAGDFDGDGIDEIDVYYGTNEVRIYDTGAYGTSLGNYKLIEEDELLKDPIDPSQPSDNNHGTATNEHKFVHRAAIVTLTAGDLKKDFSDDLVITVSMPQENDNNAHLENPYAYIYGLDTNKDSTTRGSLVKDEEIRLYIEDFQGDQDKPEQVFKAANATIGDIDGDACMELIIGGRLCDASSAGTDDTGWNWGALIPVEYDHGSKQYSVGTATQMKLDEYDGDDILIKAHCDDLRYSAPVGMAVADLDGVGSDAPHLFFFSELFTYNADTKSFEGTDMYLDTIKNQTNNVNENESKGQHWVSDVVVGNFNGNDDGADQIIAIVACKESDNSSTDGDWYWYYMSYIAKETEEKDGSIVIKSNGEICRQCEGIINQGRSYINRTDKSRASTFVSIACPDVDNDSILLEHLDTETYYSKPEVQAVLQSAPYFADVAEVYDNYLNNGETAYGKLDASGQGVQASVSAKLGAYVDVEFQAGAAADLEAELAVTTSYEHASIDEVETEVSYSGAIGDDYVVMYTIPYIRYYYNATYPDGTTGLMKIEEPLTPATVIVPVETYDEIAATTEGLEPIRGNILTSTPGEPMTYLSAPKGDWHGIGSDQALTNAGSNSSSLVTVSQTSTSTKEHSFAVGIEENFKIGFGTGAVGNKVTAGITQGLSADAGGVYSNMKGVVYTGAVDNLPAGVTGYAFNWQFGISETKLNGEDIIVVGYKTSNVKQAPSITRNLAVTEVGSDYVELEWNKNNDAAMYELSISRDGNTWNLLKSIPATAAVGNTVRYRVTDLSDDTVFYFKVGASNAFGIRSLDSASVSAVTLAGENVSFEITSQPTNFSTHAGGNASFNVETKTNISSDIHYEWQYNDGDGWFKIGYDSPALTISNVTKAMDGRAVRCRVSQVANYMYSQVAYLEVSKSATETDLQIMNGSTEIKNADIVNASVIEYEPETTPITIWKEDDADGYLKMADKETVSDDGAHSYDGARFIWSKTETTGTGDDAQTVTKYYNKTVSDGNTSYEELTTFKNTFHKIAEDENIDVIKTASDTTTLDSAVEIGENTSSSGYLIDGTSDENPEYVYVVVETLDTGSTPDEDKANSTTKKTTYYVKEDESFIEVSLGDTIIVIGEEDYYISSFVPVMVAATDNIITGYTPVHSDGDELTFTATVDKGDQAAALAGSASFQLRNLATGLITTVPATKNDDGETFTATHTFTETGLFSVTAVYGGDASYFGSTSQPVVIYVSADSATLSITG